MYYEMPKRIVEDMIDKKTKAHGETLRKNGLPLFRSEDPIRQEQGLAMILQAAKWEDKEAAEFVVGLIVRGVLYPTGDEELPPYVMIGLRKRANHGDMRARSLMDDYCLRRYKYLMRDRLAAPKQNGPLVGFDGKPIKIKRKGMLTPVDAILSYENGFNRLDLKVCVFFPQEDFGEVKDVAALKKAVLDGIRMWQGTYSVFGGQRLKVVVDAQEVSVRYDSVYVYVVTPAQKEEFLKKASDSVKRFLEQNRTFMSMGRKWSVRGFKSIKLCSEDPTFSDCEEICHAVKHEFGHLLGLGDLYSNKGDGLPGVQKGTFTELDGYYISNKRYNLVMSNHHGPISDNDVEMVVLAFQKNKEQLYQKTKKKDKISIALGRGN